MIQFDERIQCWAPFWDNDSWSCPGWSWIHETLPYPWESLQLQMHFTGSGCDFLFSSSLLCGEIHSPLHSFIYFIHLCQFGLIDIYFILEVTTQCYWYFLWLIISLLRDFFFQYSSLHTLGKYYPKFFLSLLEALWCGHKYTFDM